MKREKPTRAETGPMRFGSDWRGIFIRGDDAISFLARIQHLINDVKQKNIYAQNLENIVDLLERALENEEDPDLIELRDFEFSLPEKHRAFYKDYKGNIYELFCAGKHTETQEGMIVYRDSLCNFWVLPHDQFFGTIEVDGKTVNRFEKIERGPGIY